MRFKYVQVGDADPRVYPERGLVVVTGANGAGKSLNVVEARQFVLFGDTLRGSAPIAGFTVKAGVVLDDGSEVHLERTPRKLTWALDGQKPVVYETKTKAADALVERLAIDETTWRVTTVFTSLGVGSFTSVGDAERKRLVEGLLGLGRLDSAYVQAREDLRLVAAAQADADRVRGRMSAEVARLKATEAALRTLLVGDPVPVDPPDPMLETEARTHQEAARAARARLAALSEKRGEAQALLRRAEEFSSLLSMSTCPTCARGMDEHTCALLEGQREAMQAEAQSKLDWVRAEQAQAEQEANKHEGARLALERQLSGQRVAYSNYVRDQRAADAIRMSHQGKCDAAAAEVAKAQEDYVAADRTCTELAAEANILQVCVHTLSPTGFRAALFDRVLSAVEMSANALGDRLGAFPVRLRSQTTLASGAVRDKIELSVVGRPSVDALSVGERRRLDVALLFALADVVGASGELILDEVFDGLDVEGLDRAAEVLRELAGERLVIVVSHNEHLVGRLRPDAHWRF
jgi:DNA repair exonuclease SbcCD ATPase subunit